MAEGIRKEADEEEKKITYSNKKWAHKEIRINLIAQLWPQTKADDRHSLSPLESQWAQREMAAMRPGKDNKLFVPTGWVVGWSGGTQIILLLLLWFVLLSCSSSSAAPLPVNIHASLWNSRGGCFPWRSPANPNR